MRPAAMRTGSRRQIWPTSAKIARLKKLETELEQILSECAGGRAGECNVLATLADHALCTTDHRHANQISNNPLDNGPV